MVLNKKVIFIIVLASVILSFVLSLISPVGSSPQNENIKQGQSVFSSNPLATSNTLATKDNSTIFNDNSKHDTKQNSNLNQKYNNNKNSSDPYIKDLSTKLSKSKDKKNNNYVNFLYAFLNLDFNDSDEDTFLLDQNSLIVEYDGYYNNMEFQTYTIKKGDNLISIAKKFNSNIDTLISFNKIQGMRYLSIGAILVIPSIKGILHTVKKGDSLDKISKKYDVRLSDIIYINALNKLSITMGERLFIPGAKLPAESHLRLLKDIFARPVSGVISSPYGVRLHPVYKKYRLHTGLDIKARRGSPVRAARAGKVIFAGWKGSYGKLVILSHGKGVTTYYGHLSRILTRRGRRVKAKQIIGRVGSTGVSTGPHLHFEIRKNNKPQRVLRKFRGLHGRVGGYW